MCALRPSFRPSANPLIRRAATSTRRGRLGRHDLNNVAENTLVQTFGENYENVCANHGFMAGRMSCETISNALEESMMLIWRDVIYVNNPGWLCHQEFIAGRM